MSGDWPRTSRGALLLALHAGVALSACSGDDSSEEWDGGTPLTCRLCPDDDIDRTGLFCYRERACPDCPLEAVGCVSLCDDSDDCDPGHRCVAIPDPRIAQVDAGSGDAGADAGGVLDASPSADAQPADGAAPDASPATSEAGPPDAALTEAGPPDAALTDAALTDAGPPDAGPSIDAGPTTSPGQELHICNPHCDRTVCGERRICAGDLFGACIRVDCSPWFGCEDPAEICDESQYRCFTATGECGAERSCPRVSAEIDERFDRYCDDVEGVCRLATRPPTAPVEADGAIDVECPRIGGDLAGSDRCTDARDICPPMELRWRSQRSPTVAFVMDRDARSPAEIADHAIWTVSVPAGGPGRATWSMGRSRTPAGAWGPPVDPPRGVPLYFVVGAVSEGRLLAISRSIPFDFGGATWACPGDRCADEATIAGTCDSPAHAMICQHAACRVLCLSQRDCDAVGGTCSGVLGGVRTCR